jgi:hypothetical protein
LILNQQRTVVGGCNDAFASPDVIRHRIGIKERGGIRPYAGLTFSAQGPFCPIPSV